MDVYFFLYILYKTKTMLYSKRRKNLGGVRNKRSNRRSYRSNRSHMIGGKIKTFEEFENKLIGLYQALDKFDSTTEKWREFHKHLTGLQNRYPEFNDKFQKKYQYN